jgi:hypothetical protein
MAGLLVVCSQFVTWLKVDQRQTEIECFVWSSPSNKPSI